MATQLMGEDYGSVVEVLQRLLADGQISGSDLEGLVKELVQGATDNYVGRAGQHNWRVLARGRERTET